MVKYSTTLLILAIGLTCCNNSGSSIDPNSTFLEDAKNAYFQMDHKTAYSVYCNVFSDPSQSDKDKATAGRYKAKMEWLFYQDDNKAFQTIDSVQLVPVEKSAAYLLQARIFASQKKWDNALESVNSAIQESKSESEVYRAKLASCQYLLDKFMTIAQSGQGNDLAQNPEFQSAYVDLKELFDPRPGDVDLAKISLGYSILAKDGESLFSSWMSFFRLTQMDQIHPSLLESPESFKEATTRYSELDSSKGDSELIIKALAESGFYEYAALMQVYLHGSETSSDLRIKDILTYQNFLEYLKIHNEDFYIKTLNEDFSISEYHDAILEKGKILWKELTWEGSVPEFSRENLQAELNKRFKAIVKMMAANGFHGMHMGHVVLDDRRTISQYNESAEFRYIAIDHMVSNGYSAWFWDGLAESGGWASNDESFLQIRSAYTSGPVRSYMKQTDSVKIKETLQDIERMRISDDSLARANPYSYLPGLAKRIDYREKKKILDSLKSTGLEGSALRLAYINYVEFITQESSIYAHEGRHAIDKKNDYSDESEELEFTAKLSEIYFASQPFDGFLAILSRNIGDRSSHGQSNLRVIKGLVKWMEENKQQIDDFDESRPTLPQIDKLTDNQLRQAVKSMDPLAI